MVYIVPHEKHEEIAPDIIFFPLQRIQKNIIKMNFSRNNIITFNFIL